MNRKKNKSNVRVDNVSAPANPPLESNTVSGTPTANTVKSSENPVSQNSSQAATEAEKNDSSLRGIASSSERLKDGTIKNDEPSYDDSGYIATPGHYQPQNEVEAKQEKAMDEWIKEETAKLQGATGNAASPTVYTAAPERYQPQNKVEAEQERAMDEWMKEKKAIDEWIKEETAKLQRATANSASPTGYTAAPGRYQPQNKVEAEQERAIDE